MPLHLLSVIGARPQFVKCAMVVEAVRKHNQNSAAGQRIRHTLVHTGQHYDKMLSDVFFEELPLPKPQHNLGVGSGTHGQQTGELLSQIEEVLIKESPDWVAVYGDTNSTLAGALAAAKLHIPVAHIEAGLRSFNRLMPEEINRVVTDHVSSLLLCPTKTAVGHLHTEGITKGVHLSGDVMLDAVLKFKGFASPRSRVLSKLGVESAEYLLFTMHRAENTDSVQHLSNAIDLLLHLQRPAVFPVHPRTKHRLDSTPQLRRLGKHLFSAEHIHAIDPVSYLDMLALEGNARVILTDSGGVQKEAYFLGVPCLTLRSETEWIETLEGGWNRLLSPALNGAGAAVEGLWDDIRPGRRPNLDAFGGGNASHNIVRHLVEAIQ